MKNDPMTDMCLFFYAAVQLAKSPVLSKYDLSSLRILGCGAAPLGKEHVEAVQARIPAAIKQG